MVLEMLQARYDTYLKDRENVMILLESLYSHESNSNKNNKDVIAEMFDEFYSLVLSRSAALGPEWNNQHGIIPFHDMMNHPPKGCESNVELFCCGDVCKSIGHVHTHDMLDRLVKDDDDDEKEEEEETVHSSSGTCHGNDANETENLDSTLHGNRQLKWHNADIVLVATREICEGEELWLRYKKLQQEDDPRKKLWFMLQYGFPLQE
jgi:hypothetical protein